jgi:CheY-like chemotaxis protein
MPRILVVDDEPDVRELVEVLLAGQRYEIDGADGGKIALECLAHQAYNLIVSDLRMPDVDGVALYEAVQDRPIPPPAMLFMSAFTNAAEFVPFPARNGHTGPGETIRRERTATPRPAAPWSGVASAQGITSAERGWTRRPSPARFLTPPGPPA